jgi:hypothetical protein
MAGGGRVTGPAARRELEQGREGRFRRHAVDRAGGSLVIGPAALLGRGRRRCARSGMNACVGVGRAGK